MGLDFFHTLLTSFCAPSPSDFAPYSSIILHDARTYAFHSYLTCCQLHLYYYYYHSASRDKNDAFTNSGQYVYLDTLLSTNSYVAYYLPKSDKMYIDEPTELKVSIRKHESVTMPPVGYLIQF